MEALSVDIERKVRALVDAGYYSNKSEVIKNAVISLSISFTGFVFQSH
jgi:Arc/MetJ-type ribon-helix-helix transcriptional regulator